MSVVVARGGRLWEFVSERGGLGAGRAPEDPDWLLVRDTPGGTEGVMRSGKTGLLAAEGGAGKTAMLCGLSLCVALGRRWLDTFEVPTPGKVLLVLGEEDEEEAMRRLHASAVALGLSERERALAAERVMLVPLAGVPCGLLEKDPSGNDVDSGFSEALWAACEGHEWRLVVLDPLSRFAGKETETDSSAATRFVQALERLAGLPGRPSVLCAHHTTKSSREEDRQGSKKRVGGTAVRGSGALVDGVRWAATLTDDGDGRVTLRVTKSNYAPKGRPVVLERRSGGTLLPPEEFR